MAILNIVNNIPDLSLGYELRTFKDWTKNMDPHERGEAIGEFAFMRQIHNSFATENQLLEADLVMKEKIAAVKRKEAAAKGLATKRAKKAAAEKALQEAQAEANARATTEAQDDTSEEASKQRSPSPDTITVASPKSSQQNSPNNAASAEHKASTATRKSGRKTVTHSKESTPSRRSLRSGKSTEDIISNPDDIFNPSVKGKVKAASKPKTTAKSKTKSKPESTESTPSRRSSRNKKPTEDVVSDAEDNFGPSAKSKAKGKAVAAPQTNGYIDAVLEDNKPRRSGRSRKQRQTYGGDDEDEDEEEEQYQEAAGFHFIAFMPIGDHVWKLDGLDSQPTDLGSFKKGDQGANGDWIDTAMPYIQARMNAFQSKSVNFNLMAVVHDTAEEDRQALAENVKTLNEIESKLTAIADDWYEMDDGKYAKGVVRSFSGAIRYVITQADIDNSAIPPELQDKIETHKDDMHELLELRKPILSRQQMLRENIQESLDARVTDDQMAEHKQHSSTNFQPMLRGWAEALAENEVLEGLLN